MMKSTKLTICSVGLLIMTWNLVQAQDWRGIRPLQSTRADVEKLIGKPMQMHGFTYDLQNERVTFVYSEGTCVKGWPYGWNVPAGTVLSIHVYPRFELRLQDLNLELKVIERTVSPYNSKIIYITNPVTGMSIEAIANTEKVKSISYTPPKSSNHLLCADAAAREIKIANGESAYLRPFIYYGDIADTDEKVRLDLFSDYFRLQTSRSTIYIISYAGQLASWNEARAHGDRVRNYLVDKREVDPRSIVIIDGGHRDDLKIELYVVPPAGPRPLASPNIHPKNVTMK